jgi:hypothetical protein
MLWDAKTNNRLAAGATAPGGIHIPPGPLYKEMYKKCLA